MAQLDCIAREFGCDCQTGECQSATVPLGRFVKVNDMTGVFTPSARIQIAFLAFVAVMLLIGCTSYQLNQAEKQEIARAV